MRLLRAIDSTVSTVAGFSGCGNATDGPLASAKLGRLSGIALAANGDLYLASPDVHIIRKVWADNALMIFANVHMSAVHRWYIH